MWANANDIALVHLATAVVLGPNIIPVCLPLNEVCNNFKVVALLIHMYKSSLEMLHIGRDGISIGQSVLLFLSLLADWSCLSSMQSGLIE